MTDQFCSTLSMQAGEPLFASAPQAEVFFLLEYNGAWGVKAFEESGIPTAVKEALSAAAHDLPTAKILLIKRSLAARQGRLTFFVVLASEQNPALYEFHLDDYEDLLAIDLPAVIRRDPGYQDMLASGPLFLVCTNGRRDACCARYGVPLDQAMQQSAAGAVWECSHVGGHRFAANVYQMPDGLLYGRLRPQDASSLAAAVQEKRILLDHLRGRSAYAPALQAAEYYYRLQTGQSALNAFHLESAEQVEPGRWEIVLRSTQDNALHRLQIAVEKTETLIYESCSLEKQTRLTLHHLVGLDQPL